VERADSPNPHPSVGLDRSEEHGHFRETLGGFVRGLSKFVEVGAAIDIEDLIGLVAFHKVFGVVEFLGEHRWFFVEIDQDDLVSGLWVFVNRPEVVFDNQPFDNGCWL
jgi:hypothetical protein